MTVFVAGCGPHAAMAPTCKIVANPDATSEPRFLALAEAYAHKHGYAFSILDSVKAPGTNTVIVSRMPVLRLIKRDRVPAYGVFFYHVEGAYSRERVKWDAKQFAADIGSVAGFNLRPMQSDEAPHLKADESACRNDQPI